MIDRLAGTTNNEAFMRSRRRPIAAVTSGGEAIAIDQAPTGAALQPTAVVEPVVRPDPGPARWRGALERIASFEWAAADPASPAARVARHLQAIARDAL